LRLDSLSADVERMSEGLLRACDKLTSSPALPPGMATLIEQKRITTKFDLALTHGRRAFRQGNDRLAAACLEEAVGYRKSARLWLLAKLMKLCPSLLRAASALRCRL
jgi:hypothetical protein